MLPSKYASDHIFAINFHRVSIALTQRKNSGCGTDRETLTLEQWCPGALYIRPIKVDL